jgi:hypothetical protein
MKEDSGMAASKSAKKSAKKAAKKSPRKAAKKSATKADRSEADALFERVARPWLSEQGVGKSTMMGFPCLRVDGKFFASINHRELSLIVKLPQERVSSAVAAGDGIAFAPSGRVFREWLEIPAPGPGTRYGDWDAYLAEAHAFVAASA